METHSTESKYKVRTMKTIFRGYSGGPNTVSPSSHGSEGWGGTINEQITKWRFEVATGAVKIINRVMLV